MDTRNRADTSAKNPPAQPAEPEQASPLPPPFPAGVTVEPVGRWFSGGFFGSGN